MEFLLLAIFIPPPIKLTNKCKRCGLLYPKGDNHCSHCYELTDKEVIDLKNNVIKEHNGNKELGKLLLFFATIIILSMILIIL